MNSNESQAITAEWLEARGFKRNDDDPNALKYLPLESGDFMITGNGGGFVVVLEKQTEKQVTRLLVALGVWPDERERRMEEALREIADAPRLTSLHEYSGELCDAKWTADVARAALEDK